MAYFKKFENLKMGTTVANGVVGPQTVTASAVLLSALVPCKGARQIIFILKATDTNGTANGSCNVANAASGTGALTATSTGHTFIGSTTGRMDQGGARMSIYAPAPYIAHDFVQLSVTANAAGHTGFTVDCEVWYTGDADDTRAQVGQASVVPV